eukprot:m.77766 g.77766  ORF g.77766 m.77766 type:complete len:381 (-) comp25046_c0_seq1:81-1223(-)
MSEDKREFSDDENDEEELDPRVEGALGELNTATDDINTSEKDLEIAKKAFKQAMAQVQIDLQQLMQKIGKKSIDKARPYHNALYKARKAHYEARRAAQQYEQASDSQRKSKTMVQSFEKDLMKGGTFNPSLQQKLNQATQSVMEADKRKRKAADVHSRTTRNFLEADEELMNLAKTRKKIILKTQPYFSCKERHDKNLLKLKEELMRHEKGVKSAKDRVKAALKMLEDISLEIHEKRKETKRAANKNQEDLNKAIADAQADAVRREKAEQERLAQEEAERLAAEEAARIAEEEAKAAEIENNGETKEDEDSPNEAEEEPPSRDVSEVSDEDIRTLIQQKLVEVEFVDDDQSEVVSEVSVDNSVSPEPKDDSEQSSKEEAK